ncbi:hypothetical protein HDU97_004168 [Phlyctochytrium planicorne]|nr:hypothetical protein HDU97_004168 [Phlyctochytrium planicorne]
MKTSLLGLLVLLATSANAGITNMTMGDSCPIGGASCAKSNDGGGSCCVPNNGNLVLALQWLPGYCVGVTDACGHDILDRLPKEQWTIHGLWPNTCRNQQVSNCDKRREHLDVLDRTKDLSIYEELIRYWYLCLPKSITDIQRFFEVVLELRNRFNVFEALQDSGIVPSDTKTYTQTEIKGAITKKYGTMTVAIRCKGAYLSEMRLALIGANPGFAKTSTYGLPSSCPRKGIKYKVGHLHVENKEDDMKDEMNEEGEVKKEEEEGRKRIPLVIQVRETSKASGSSSNAIRSFSLPDPPTHSRHHHSRPDNRPPLSTPTPTPPSEDDDDDDDSSSIASSNDASQNDDAFLIEEDESRHPHRESQTKKKKRRKKKGKRRRGDVEQGDDDDDDDDDEDLNYLRRRRSMGSGLSKSLNHHFAKSFEAARRNSILMTARQISRAQMRNIASITATTATTLIAPLVDDSGPPGSTYGSLGSSSATLADPSSSTNHQNTSMPPPREDIVTPASALVEMGGSGKVHKEEAEGSSTLQTIFNTVNLLLGLGLLSLPYAMRCGGWIPGLLILVSTALVTAYTAYILSRCLSLPSQRPLQNFADIGERAFGPHIRPFVSILFISELFVTCVAFIILISDSLNALLPIDLMWCRVIAFAVCTAGTFVRQLKWISYASLIGVVASVNLVAVVVWDGLTKTEKPGSVWDWERTEVWSGGIAVSLCFGIVMAGFAGHAVLPNIYLDMKDKSKFPLVLAVSFSIALTLYTTVAACGYMMFGDKTLEEITKNLAMDGSSVNKGLDLVTTGLIAFIPVPKFALTMAPVAIALDQYIGSVLHRNGLLSLPTHPVTPNPHQSSQHTHSHAGGHRLILTPPRPIQLILRTLLGAGTALLPLVIPHFDVVLSLLGCIFSTLVSVVIPVGCYLMLFGVGSSGEKSDDRNGDEDGEEDGLLGGGKRMSMHWVEAVICWVLVVVGSVVGVVATIGSVWPGARPI